MNLVRVCEYLDFSGNREASTSIFLCAKRIVIGNEKYTNELKLGKVETLRCTFKGVYENTTYYHYQKNCVCTLPVLKQIGE